MNQPLHVAYTLKNQKAFRQLLDRAHGSGTSNANPSGGSAGGGMSSSGPRSWTNGSILCSSGGIVDVNAKDSLGRTVLHRVCSSLEPATVDYLRMLLNHPSINVNVQDSESRWTPLHRALYTGNIIAAVLLLQRPDVDIQLRDNEGHTAFDVYNSTVENTKPGKSNGPYDLFTWGANRNAALGHGDGNDRAYPELVNVPRGKYDGRKTGSAKFYPLQVKTLSMSKLHTALITAETRGNMRVCGFGSGGRLGGNQSTQYALTPLPHFDNQVIAVACGQDHTLALTQNNEILSWGLNRFAQLGYVIESPPTLQKSEEPIQITPRKVVGLLRGKKIIGIAACRMASVGWTSTTVYTWGTNSGQLGYQEQIQVTPRAVPTLANAVGVAITDAAMVCLLESKDVLCFANNTHFKIAFPVNAWPSEVKPYRPPQSGPPIVKVASCESTFVALSELGDLFTFTSPTEAAGTAGRPKWTLKPQRVWALRKQMSAVVDVAPGQDGSLILCTESGHVYVRARSAKPGNMDLRRQQQPSQGPSPSSKTFKFQRVPSIQRVVRVCTNSTGAYAALRIDVKPDPIAITGNTLADDLAGVRPFVVHPTLGSLHVDVAHEITSLEDTLAALSIEHKPSLMEEEEEAPVDTSIKVFSQLLGVLTANRYQESADLARAHGADTIICCGVDIPVHRIILESRCTVMQGVFRGKTVESGPISISLAAHGHLEVVGCHPLAMLVVLHYLYSDNVPAFWDRRVGSIVSELMIHAGTGIPTLKAEVETLARILRLDTLLSVLALASQRMPSPTLGKDMSILFAEAQTALFQTRDPRSSATSGYDMVLELSDRNVACHTAVLRARSPLFASFLDDEEWTARRWENGVLNVDFKHLAWRPMAYVFKFIYEGGETAMFDTIEFANTPDDYIDFLLTVLGCATELFLDRLVLVCSSVILRHVNVMNVCALLADSSYFHATELVSRLQTYMAMNLECLLENRILEDMDMDLIGQLAKAIQLEQAKKLHISRSNHLVDHALEKHADWLKLQDIPQPIVRSSKAILAPRQSPRLSPTPPAIGKPANRSPPRSIPESPVNRPRRDNIGDDIFEMDEEHIPPLALGSPHLPGLLSATSNKESGLRSMNVPAWRSHSVSTAKVNLKAIMAQESSRANVGTSSSHVKPQTRISGFQPASTTPSVATSTPRDIRRPWGSTVTPLTAPSASSFPTLSSALPSRTPPSATSALSGLSSALPSRTPPRGSFFTLGSSADSWSSPAPSETPRRVVDNMLAAPTTPQRVPSGQHLGPTFIPSRMPSNDSIPSKRRTDAWSTPPVEPVVSTPPSAGGASFAAIQQQQQQQLSNKARPKKSLLEIQREEEERRAEIDFISWWTAEEERLRSQAQAVEAELAAASSSSPINRKPYGGRGGKRTSNVKRKPAVGALSQKPSNGSREPPAARLSHGPPS